ncbi:hypothetical protein LXL04_009979 [Taraxacum kok-saghyz]
MHICTNFFLHICKLFEKKKLFFRKFFFATSLKFERFLAPRSRIFENVNGLRVLGAAHLIRPSSISPSDPTRFLFHRVSSVLLVGSGISHRVFSLPCSDLHSSIVFELPPAFRPLRREGVPPSLCPCLCRLCRDFTDFPACNSGASSKFRRHSNHSDEKALQCDLQYKELRFFQLYCTIHNIHNPVHNHYSLTPDIIALIGNRWDGSVIGQFDNDINSSHIYREDKVSSKLAVAIIHFWYHVYSYIKSMPDLIKKELQSFNKSQQSSTLAETELKVKLSSELKMKITSPPHFPITEIEDEDEGMLNNQRKLFYPDN